MVDARDDKLMMTKIWREKKSEGNFIKQNLWEFFLMGQIPLVRLNLFNDK